MNDVLQQLMEARDKIADPKHWTRDAFARNRDGEACDPNDPAEAYSFCMSGALGDEGDDSDAVLALEETITDYYGNVGGNVMNAAAFNDASGIEHDDVLFVFDKTIEDLEKGT